mmetsp:Transcript_9330/g.29791  ORF Transcript_9330/g.29791 Transcript_9330/m.29791 type:complete len:173 (-) Transcript_9330:671-1189(-)
MFCLDFALGFAAHLQLARALGLDAPSGAGWRAGAAHGGLGLAAGGAAALVLAPFDVLRHTAAMGLPAQAAARRLPAGVSTVPFMAVYLGTFYGLVGVDPAGPFQAKVAAAGAAATMAAAVEFPLDRAKHALAGGRASAAVATAARIPLSALLLLAYDRILCGATAVQDTPLS